PLTPWGEDRVSVELYWQADANDYDLAVTDDRGASVGRCATHRGDDRCCSVVSFKPEGHCTYQVQLRQTRGQGGPFHLVVLGGGLRYATRQGSIACPADNPAVLAVGAVHGDGRRASY